jgi:hypothetical protein
VQVYEARQRVLGAEHPDTLSSLNNLAVALQNQGKAAEAEPLHRQVTPVPAQGRAEGTCGLWGAGRMVWLCRGYYGLTLRCVS